MKWNIDFISESDFEKHVKNTIQHYGEKLKPYDIKRFNSNVIDPIKLIFDKSIYNKTWHEIVGAEIFRQRDKSNNNEVGYFHQRMFQYITSCRVPDNGKDGGWDVICDIPNGYEISTGNIVHTIYVEIKNKHNTMNSAASNKTYIKMQDQLLMDDDCACFLVEVIAKKSQNTVWKTSVDRKVVSHARIRRISIDKFYEIITGEADAFLKLCLVLPNVIDKLLLSASTQVTVPHDTVYEKIKEISEKFKGSDENTAMVMALYMLGFSSYNGFLEMFNGFEEI